MDRHVCIQIIFVDHALAPYFPLFKPDDQENTVISTLYFVSVKIEKIFIVYVYSSLSSASLRPKRRIL